MDLLFIFFPISILLKTESRLLRVRYLDVYSRCRANTSGSLDTDRCKLCCLFCYYLYLCINFPSFHIAKLHEFGVLCSKVDPEIATLETYKCRLFVFYVANFPNWLIQLGIHENKHERMPHSKM